MDDPIHPLTYEEAKWFQERFLTYKLRETMHDSSSHQDSMTDRVSTCPTAIGQNPRSNFVNFASATGNFVRPTYYALNNYGSETFPLSRATKTPHYFGFSSESMHDPAGEELELKYPPQPITKVQRPAEEWMMADAWYREAQDTRFDELAQEGRVPGRVDRSGTSVLPTARLAWAGSLFVQLGSQGPGIRRRAIPAEMERQTLSFSTATLNPSGRGRSPSAPALRCSTASRAPRIPPRSAPLLRTPLGEASGTSPSPLPTRRGRRAM